MVRDPRFLASSQAANEAGHGRMTPSRRTRRLGPRSALGVLREARGLATHIALYPLGLFETTVRGSGAQPDSDTFDLPVVLVHGYFHNRSGFYFMARTLRRRGFRWVYGMNYNPLGESVPSLAARLSNHVEDVLRVSGAPRVHLVGHSLGGVVARWYLQEMGGADNVDHCVTIGTPHLGTFAAYLGLGQTAKEMRPGSPMIQRLEAGFDEVDTTFVNLYSDLDVLIVPSVSAILPERANVHNHLIRDFGHTSLLVSPELMSTVVDHLARADVRTPLAEVRHLPKRGAAGAEGDSAESGR